MGLGETSTFSSQGQPSPMERHDARPLPNKVTHQGRGLSFMAATAYHLRREHTKSSPAGTHFPGLSPPSFSPFMARQSE